MGTVSVWRQSIPEANWTRMPRYASQATLKPEARDRELGRVRDYTFCEINDPFVGRQRTDMVIDLRNLTRDASPEIRALMREAQARGFENPVAVKVSR